MANNRVTFGSKLGVVLATVGCAVGLRLSQIEV